MNIPTDPVILLSFVNTQLRDFYPTLEDFCEDAGITPDQLQEKLSAIDYIYDKTQNQFI